MRIDNVGRKRKKLEDKSTTLMFRIDNKTLFLLCDKFGIDYNEEGEFVDSETVKSLVLEIEKIVIKIVE